MMTWAPERMRSATGSGRVEVAGGKAGVFAAPEVLADGEADAGGAARGTDVDHAGAGAWHEIAVFVEDVVRGKEALVIAGDDRAAAERDERVGDARARVARKREADDDREPLREPARE